MEVRQEGQPLRHRIGGPGLNYRLFSVHQVWYPAREYRRKTDFVCRDRKLMLEDPDRDYQILEESVSDCWDCVFAEDDPNFPGDICPGKWEPIEPVRHMVWREGAGPLSSMQFRCGWWAASWGGSSTWTTKEPPTCPECLEWLKNYLRQLPLPFPNGYDRWGHWTHVPELARPVPNWIDQVKWPLRNQVPLPLTQCTRRAS